MAEELRVLLVLAGCPFFCVHAGDKEIFGPVLGHLANDILEVAVEADRCSDTSEGSVDGFCVLPLFSVVEEVNGMALNVNTKQVSGAESEGAIFPDSLFLIDLNFATRHQNTMVIFEKGDEFVVVFFEG